VVAQLRIRVRRPALRGTAPGRGSAPKVGFREVKNGDDSDDVFRIMVGFVYSPFA
jgi:hypothetical protein